MLNRNGRLKKAYYSSVTSALYQIISVVCGLVLPRLILSAYGSTYNGVISSITQFLSFFTILQAGIQGSTRVALYKTLAAKDDDGTSAIMLVNERYYRKISLILGGYIVFLALIFPFLMNEGISKREVVLLVLIIGASNFVQYFFGNAYKALLTADQAMYLLNILQTITVVLNTLICAVIIILGGSVLVAKLGSAVIYALNPIVLYIYVQHHYKLRKDVKPDNSALKGRWDVLANSLANIVHENVDILFITFFCSAAEVSVYAVYNLVSSGLVRLMQVFTNGIEAPFGDMWANKEKAILNTNFRKYEYVMFCVSDVLAGCMMVLILPFVTLYTKNVNDVNYIRPVFAFLLTLALATMCIRMPYITMVQAAGHYKQTKIGSYIEAGINIVLTLILVQRVGISGAIIGTVVANTFRSIQYGVYVSNNLIHRPIKSFLYRCIWLVFTMGISIFTTNLAISFVSMQGWTGWIIKALLCGLIHFIILYLSSIVFYRNDLKQLLKHLLKK